ncbi:MAG: hypothetical protein EFT35_09805 [Methanophagales archaeon ANME-1-THS]|nr:MAG: hypothetical protein EFT35_09805 [Methanophagales archaeon ANME-1-THS]
MRKRPWYDRCLRTVIALCGVVVVLVCIIHPSSAGIDANIVITKVMPTELVPGETKALTLTIQNAGSYDARRITLNFLENQYISVVGSSSVSIASLGGWSTKDLTITVHVAKGAPSGTYAIPVTCTFDQYNTEGTQAVTETMPEVSYSIALRVAQGAIIVISDIAPSELEPGERTDLSFTITNVGNYPLEDLVFSWTEAKGVLLPVNSDNTKYIEHIDVGASAVVAYTVVADVNADAGLYQLDLTIEFDDERGGSRSINTRAGIVIGGGTDFDVTVIESSSGQTSLSVANIGNNPAYSVSVRIPEQEQFRVQGSTASIVGNLDKGDYTIVSFQITSLNATFGGTGTAQLSQQAQLPEEERQGLRAEFSQRNATQSNNLQVAIDYTDTTGVRRTVEKAVPMQLQTTGSQALGAARRSTAQQSIGKNPLVIGALAAVMLILGVVLYLRTRRRRAARRLVTPSSQKENEQEDEIE